MEEEEEGVSGGCSFKCVMRRCRRVEWEWSSTHAYTVCSTRPPKNNKEGGEGFKLLKSKANRDSWDNLVDAIIFPT